MRKEQNEQTDGTKSVALEMLPAGSNVVRLHDEGKGGYDIVNLFMSPSVCVKVAMSSCLLKCFGTKERVIE